MSFVGATSAQGHLLPVVTGVSALHEQAKQMGADFVVVDSSGMVSGINGQVLKYHKVEMLRPDLVVGLQRGEELLPLLGVIQRFFATEVVPLGVHPGVVPTTVDQRSEPRDRDAAVLLRASCIGSGSTHGVHAGAAAAVRPREPAPSAGGPVRRGPGAYTGISLEHAPDEASSG